MKKTTQNSTHFMLYPLIYFIASRMEKACSSLSARQEQGQADANGASVARAHTPRHLCTLQFGIYPLLQKSTTRIPAETAF